MRLEDRHFGLPDCRFKGPLEIRVSIGSRYLRFRLVEAASVLLSSGCGQL
jgi:hypothetical protein